MSIRRLADLVCELPEGTDPGLRCWVPSEACSTAGKGKGERDFQNQRQQCHLLPQNLYESIKNEPFKIPEDDGNDLTHTFFNPDREGWLLKLGGGRVKTWKRRWFILTDNCLYYFEYTTDKEPRGIIPLENLSIREVDDPRKPNCFELYIPNNKGQLIKACKTEADGRVVEGNHMVYRISAPTQEEKDEWIKSIQAAVSVDPFYEMLAARKKRISVKKKQEQP